MVVLFDMDGVIFDSERALMGCWLELAEERGLRDMETVYHRCIGVTREVTGAVLREAYGEDFPWEAFRRETSARYLARFGEGRLPLKPGVRELLSALREAGIPLALASSTEESLVRRLLADAGLLTCFDAVVCGNMVRRSKPDPEIFFKACELLGAPAGEAVVIEDSYNGVRAAYAGGMRPLMVPDLLPADAEMEEKAERIFPSLFEVRRYLLG